MEGVCGGGPHRLAQVNITRVKARAGIAGDTGFHLHRTMWSWLLVRRLKWKKLLVLGKPMWR
jgi:hypothetical protein